MSKENRIKTYTGLSIDPLDPKPDEICIEDIAHALSNTCRFTGHCNRFYSVAQHSVYVSNRISQENALWGLLHDASEAYLCDIATPIKMSNEFSKYRIAEKILMSVILEKFNLPLVKPAEVARMDMTMLATEARDLGLSGIINGLGEVKPLDITIHPQLPEEAEVSFLEWMDVISNKIWCN